MKKNSIEKIFNINVNAYRKDKNNVLRMKFILLNELKLTINFKIIGITGTNGKGSLTQYLYHGLKKKYQKIGIFTSPHLLDWTERISINEKKISKKAFWSYYKKISSIIEKYQLIFFEIFFLVSILYFLDQKIDLLILEYGIGAKNDCCNCLENDYSAITNIQIDHKNFFANSLLKTLKNKIFIFKEKSQNIVYFPEDILNLYEKKIKKKHSFINVKDYLKDINYKDGYYFFSYKGKAYQLKTFSLNQVYNCSIAIEIFLLEKILFEDIFNTLKKITIKGRFPAHFHKNCIFDPCHNLAGVTSFIHSFKNFQKFSGFFENYAIYFTCQSLKDWKNMIQILKNNFSKHKIFYIVIKNKNFLTKKQYLSQNVEETNIIVLKNLSELLKAQSDKHHFFIGSFHFLKYLKKIYF
ncbi:hypothetical protein JTY60_00810 [symbiont of Argiope bruennichi]|uniref:Mur ligase family protein n=1 Tax=symbiont of Argiope bruennichi TaxID=2810479 RepID=UPI003DA3CA2D